MKKLVGVMYTLMIVLCFITTVKAEATIKPQQLKDWGTASVVLDSLSGELTIQNGKISEKDWTYEERPWVRLQNGEEQAFPGSYSKIIFSNVQIESNRFVGLFKDLDFVTDIDMSGVSLYGSKTDYLILDSMFENCSNLINVQLSPEMENNMGAAHKMFSGARSLKQAPPINLSNCHGYSYMYKDTESLTYVDLSTIGSFAPKEGMFQGSGVKSFEIRSQSQFGERVYADLQLPESAWIADVPSDNTIPLNLPSEIIGLSNPIRESGVGLHATTDDLIQNMILDQQYATLNGLDRMIYKQAYHYSVEYHANDGTGKVIADTSDIRLESEMFFLNSGKELSNRTNFIYWNTKPDGSGIRYIPGQIINNLTNKQGEQVKLYAEYKPNPYTISYAIDTYSKPSAKGSMGNSVVEVGEEFTIPDSKFTQEGHHFSYWTTVDFAIYDPTVDPAVKYYYPGQKVTDIADSGSTLRLFTGFVPNNYTIEFDGNGGEGEVPTIKTSYTKRVELPESNYTREGYSFIGWSTDDSSLEAEFKSGDTVQNLTAENNATVTLYAVWEKEEEQNYTIKYDANVEDLSTVSGEMDDVSAVVDQDIRIAASNYDREGYTFSHWTKTKEDSEKDKFYPNDIVNNLGNTGEEVTLYAQWTPINYYIQYNDAETSKFKFEPASVASLPSYDQDMVYDKEEHLLPIRFEKTGYTNLQWRQTETVSFTNGALVKNLTSNEGDLVDLYTNWYAHRYTIAFHANGGTGEGISSIDTQYDETVQLPKENFKKSGYVFDGWTRDRDSNKVEFKSQAEVRNLTDKNGDRVTLYAVWVRDVFVSE